MGKKWGFGIDVDTGVEYVFKFGLVISVGPRVQWNMIISDENLSKNILSQKGVNLG